MEIANLIVLFFVLNCIILVKSDYGDVKTLPEPNEIVTEKHSAGAQKENGVLVPKYGIYLMAFTIFLLAVAVIGLTVYIIIYKKDKQYSSNSSICSIKVTPNNTYRRQVSTETNIILTPIPKHDEHRINMSHQNLATVEYPVGFSTNEREKRDPSREKKIQKIKQSQNMTQAPCINEDIMKKIIEGVINKTKQFKESTSLSNLDKILNEDQKNDDNNAVAIDKCSSTSMLDTCEISHLPSPLAVRRMLEKNENICSNNGSRRNMNPAFEIKDKENLNISKTNANALIKASEDDINNDKTEKLKADDNSNEALTSENDNKDLTKFNTSLSNSSTHLLSNVLLDEVYDDPPKLIRSVPSSIDHVEDIYETGPSNRPITLLGTDDNDHLDNVYDDLRKDKVMIDWTKNKSKSEDQNLDDNKNNIYETTPPNERGIQFMNTGDTDYLMALTSDTKICVDSSYVNAKNMLSPDK